MKKVILVLPCLLLGACSGFVTNVTNAANALVADSKTAVADVSSVVEAAGCDITAISPVTTAVISTVSDAAGNKALAVVDGIGNVLCKLTPAVAAPAAK